MLIQAAGREYATWPLEGVDDDTPVSVHLAGAWHTGERVPGGVRLLVAGPDATGNPAGTVVVRDWRNRALIRVPGNPEDIIRPAASAVYVEGM